MSVGQKRKSWRTNLIFLVVIWIVLLLASATILSSVVTPFLKSLQTQNLVSFDWAGYSVSSNVLFAQPIVTRISGSWTIPTVTVTSTNAFSAAWIGIGGLGETTLIQVGSQHDSVDGKAGYSLWYEMLPDDSITIPEITVSPADTISASITLTNSNANEWLIQIRDLTNGQTFSKTFAYNSSRLSAEWIVERPTVNNQVSTLANFGAVTFNEISAQIDTQTGNFKAFPESIIIMQDRQNRELASVSTYSMDGSSFTVTYNNL
jgi:hypothetical protein